MKTTLFLILCCVVSAYVSCTSAASDPKGQSVESATETPTSEFSYAAVLAKMNTDGIVGFGQWIDRDLFYMWKTNKGKTVLSVLDKTGKSLLEREVSVD